MMLIRADLSQREIVDTEKLAWMGSPRAGVQRRMLEREGDEVARATSIVRFAPGSSFSPHTHGGGEEFLVLDGVFSDEQGDYPAGTYVRNPPGSSHTPSSREGCTLFVKLCQMQAGDQQQVRIDTQKARWSPGPVAGCEHILLHEYGTEKATLSRLERRAQLPLHEHRYGEEILVLEGTLEDEHGRYPAGTWLRNPPRSRHTPRSIDGCLIFVKEGHLGS